MRTTLTLLSGLALVAGAVTFAAPVSASPAQSSAARAEFLNGSTELVQMGRRCHRVCVKRSKWGRCRAWRTHCHRR
jgi:hypothetical protein